MRRHLGRDRQARRERLPLDAHQLHQRDRERLRARRRRRRRGRPRASGSTTGSGRTSSAPGSASAAAASRRTHGAEAARRQLGLSVPAPAGGVGGERAAEAAGRAEAPAAAREPARAHRRAARARVQAEHRRHARGAEPRSSRTGCSPRAPRCGRGIRSRDRPTSRASRSATRCSRPSRDADAAVIVTEWPELRELADDRGARGDGAAADRRRPEPARSRAPSRAAGFEYEAIGRPTRATPGGVNGNPQPSRYREQSA